MTSKDIERQINKLYESVFKKIFNKTRTISAIKGKTHDIERAILRLKQSEDYEKFAKEFAKKLAKKGLSKQRGVWRKFFQAAKANHVGVLPDTYKDFELKVLNEVVKNNFKMIKSIPDKVLEVYKHKYTKTLIEEVARGNLSRGAFMKELKSHGHKNAKLIARTETAKLQTVILQNRATELGSVAYIWRASNDKRTRPSHRNMNDVVVFWREFEERPLLDNMRGNAGEFPNCRCTPQPIFDEKDLTKSNYRVYDYRTNNIVTMLKSELIEALKRGEL